MLQHSADKRLQIHGLAYNSSMLALTFIGAAILAKAKGSTIKFIAAYRHAAAFSCDLQC
jgi:hypothetical protein